MKTRKGRRTGLIKVIYFEKRIFLKFRHVSAAHLGRLTAAPELKRPPVFFLLSPEKMKMYGKEKREIGEFREGRERKRNEK